MLLIIAYFIVGCIWTARDYAIGNDWDPDADTYGQAFATVCVILWPLRLLMKICWAGTLVALWGWNFFAKERGELS
jgi:hypothetical protein